MLKCGSVDYYAGVTSGSAGWEESCRLLCIALGFRSERSIVDDFFCIIGSVWLRVVVDRVGVIPWHCWRYMVSFEASSAVPGRWYC